MGDRVPRAWPAALCDIVMKGGITSGVVYPHAVHELARHYRLKSVGGTSAGAIAAAAAAAAEYGRASGGYDRIAELPGWIGRDDNLAHLFQPQPATAAPFRVLMASMRPAGRVAALLRTCARGFWWELLLGALPGAALIALTLLGGPSPALLVGGLLGGLLLALGGATVGLLLGAARTSRAIVENGFGICSGMPSAAGGGRAALTPWLTDLIDRLAGRGTGPCSRPLTFGDLWRGPAEAGLPAGGAGPWLRLEMMTTNVTNRRAERLPSASREFWFHPDELARLFPRRVVEHMRRNPPPLSDRPARRRDQLARRRQLAPLLPMPLPEDLPVVVATRMSLSFPLLLSAVPLWRIDWSSPPGADGSPRAERCWFSDGGVASNFPIHFFDAPMPRHPTFGINLRPFPPGHEPSPDEAENVWMVRRPSEGVTDAWYRFDTAVPGLWDRRLGAFLSGIVRTMQNRVDDAQLRVPGYRDRVVHVNMSRREGGMNLAMPSETIDALTARGRHAARRLTEAYAREPDDPFAVSWDAHRWVRLRSALPAIADLLKAFGDGWSEPPANGRRSYAQLIEREDDEPPGSYRIGSAAQRALALDVGERLAALADAIAAERPTDLAADAPRPAPTARLVPQDAAADGESG